MKDAANTPAIKTIQTEDAQAADPHAAGTKLGSYIFGKNLGKGTFGLVKLATHLLTQELVSICEMSLYKIQMCVCR